MESRTKVKIVTNLNIQTPSGKLNCNKLRNLCKNELRRWWTEAWGTHYNRNIVPDAFCRFRAALCCTSAWNHIFLPFRNVFPRLHRRPDCHLVVSRINSPQLRLTLWMKSAFLFKVHLVIWNLSCILHFEQFCVYLNFCWQWSRKWKFQETVI